MGPEDIRILPPQGVFVPRISHNSRGARVIPLILAGASYDTGAFQVRGYNKLEIFNLADQKGQIYVYMGPDPAALLLRAPGDDEEKALFEYKLTQDTEGIFLVDQYSVQIAADFARVVYVNDTLGAQTTWEFQVQAKPIAEPDGIRVYDDTLVPPGFTSVYSTLTLTPDRRLRVNIATIAGAPIEVEGQPVTEIVNVDDDAVAAAASTAQTEFLIGIGAGNPAVKQITVSASIAPDGVGNGDVIIDYRMSATSPWRELERIPLGVGEVINRVIVPTRPRYRIYYTAIVATTNLDFSVITHPQT